MRRVFKRKEGWRGAALDSRVLSLESESVLSFFFARVHRVEYST